MGLRDYHRRRDFTVTAEPAGKTPARSRRGRALGFVVQKHRARQLHYDFRLEWNGVLLSWAVPKGPSLDPAQKRLAMQTEDHPLEYADFEGIIPAGQYGAGTVMIWDRGVWMAAEPDVDGSLARGDLKFALLGEKLRGSFALVRTRPRPGRSDRPAWLLIKHRDVEATDEDLALTRPRSVVSGRLLAVIAWQEGGDVAQAATGDPPGEIRRLLRAPRTRRSS
jgi:bifunctional non-homologous end joining protein LigD